MTAIDHAPLRAPALDAGAGATDPVEAIARAVLYEGYLLWPYRRSAAKNRSRFTFGALYPRGFCAAARERDLWRLRCECLLEGGPEALLGVELRCLQMVKREVLRFEGDRRVAVDELRVGDRRHLAWDEARERRHAIDAAPLAEISQRPLRRNLRLASGADEETLRDGEGPAAGSLLRSWASMAAAIEVETVPLGTGLWRVGVDVVNQADWAGRSRHEAQRHALLSTHLVLRTSGGAGFVSLTDPPPAATDVVAACRGFGVWPVLVGEPGARDTVLASPIVLEDYPRVAPESTDDLFDGAEIVELLMSSILALTDEEKAEMAATDPAARAILERATALDREALSRLHGAFRPPRGGAA